MSAPAETVATPVDEVKPTETPAAEPAPATTDAKPEESAAPAAPADAPKDDAKPEVRLCSLVSRDAFHCLWASHSVCHHLS